MLAVEIKHLAQPARRMVQPPCHLGELELDIVSARHLAPSQFSLWFGCRPLVFFS
jgi:hypothetical protein